MDYCNKSRKVKHKNKGVADAAANNIKKRERNKRGSGNRIYLSTYKCSLCGGFHLTSRIDRRSSKVKK